MTPEQSAILKKVLLFTAIFFCGWKVKGWKDAHAYDQLVIEQQKAATQSLEDEKAATRSALKQRDALQAQIANIDQVHYDELKKEQRKNDDLRNQLVSGRMRVSLPVHCAYGTTDKPADGAGVGDGAAERAVIDGQTASDIFGVAADCDQQVTKLRFLQEYTRKVSSQCSIVKE